MATRASVHAVSGMTEASIAALLDECIDALLAGEDWQQTVPPGHAARTEIERLMLIAAELHVTTTALAPPMRSQAAQDATRASLGGQMEEDRP